MRESWATERRQLEARVAEVETQRQNLISELEAATGVRRA